MISTPFQMRGATLIELMIALVLGLLLTLAIGNIFLGSRQSYAMVDGLSRLQENGRFALRRIARDIREADYMGCGSSLSSYAINNTLNNATDFRWNFSRGIEGFEATSSTAWSPTVDASISAPLGGRDIIVVRRVADTPTTVTAHPGGTPPGSANIQVAPGSDLKQFDIVMVSDCVSAAIFEITSANPGTSGSLAHNTGSVSQGPGNATQALGREYTNGGITKVSTIVYYIGTGTGGGPALFRAEGANPAQELVEGVEDMQILYGEDTDGDRDADRYVAANTVADWSDVISVRVSLLLHSLKDGLNDTPIAYTYNGATVTPTDRRLRQVFTATLNLRNRSL